MRRLEVRWPRGDNRKCKPATTLWESPPACFESSDACSRVAMCRQRTERFSPPNHIEIIHRRGTLSN